MLRKLVLTDTAVQFHGRIRARRSFALQHGRRGLFILGLTCCMLGVLRFTTWTLKTAAALAGWCTDRLYEAGLDADANFSSFLTPTLGTPEQVCSATHPKSCC